MYCSLPGSSVHGDSPGKNTRVGRLFLLQGIFLTRESTWGLPHCTWILYQLSYQGSPRILESIAYSLSRGTSRLRNWIRVSCTAGGFFTRWATRKTLQCRDLGSIPGTEDPLEKAVATHSSIPVWRIPWTEEPGELQSMGLQRVRHDWETNTQPVLHFKSISLLKQQARDTNTGPWCVFENHVWHAIFMFWKDITYKQKQLLIK